MNVLWRSVCGYMVCVVTWLVFVCVVRKVDTPTLRMAGSRTGQIVGFGTRKHPAMAQMKDHMCQVGWLVTSWQICPEQGFILTPAALVQTSLFVMLGTPGQMVYQRCSVGLSLGLQPIPLGVGVNFWFLLSLQFHFDSVRELPLGAPLACPAVLFHTCFFPRGCWALSSRNPPLCAGGTYPGQDS